MQFIASSTTQRQISREGNGFEIILSKKEGEGRKKKKKEEEREDKSGNLNTI